MNLNKTTLIQLICVVGLWLVSCNDPTQIGSNIIPGGDNIEFIVTDTLTVIATTQIEDSIRTDINIDNLQIGSISDLEFGNTFASIVVPVELPSNNVDLGEMLELDSVVLALPYRGIFGDSLASHTINVFRINEELFDSIERYSVDEVPELESNIPIATRTFVPNLEDSIDVLGEKIIPHLRIRLNDEIGNELLSYSGESQFDNNDNFQMSFPGLYIEPDTLRAGFSKSMISLDLLVSSQAKLTIYYKNDLEDSLKFDLPINPSSEVFSLYRNNLQNSEIQQAIDNSSSNKLYLKGMQGTNIQIEVPYIENLGEIAINKAEFVLTEIEDLSFEDYERFEQILATKPDSSGLLVTRDFFEGENFYDGNLFDTESTSGIPTMAFRINTPLHIQEIYDGLEENKLVIIPVPRLESPRRMVFGNLNHTEFPLKLNLVYTKIE